MNYKLTILYVEDEAGIRENVKRPLTYFSSKLFIACDGKEGLELYKEHKPDLVITDIKMPNMNGIEMSKAIKAINPKQHIIITTAHNESNFFMDAIEMHIDAYILKPIDIDLLEEQVEKITEHINTKKSLEEQIILTQEISQLQSNCLVVLDEEDELIFTNNQFLDFFNVNNIVEFRKKYQYFYKVFVEHSDCFYPKELEEKNWMEQLENLENDKRIVSILDIDGNNKIFIISPRHIEKSLHTIVSFIEITSLAIEKKEFKQKAYRDELTQVYNRAYFEEAFIQEIARYKRDSKPLSFIMIDIDHFKSFNDNYGHQVGDDILSELAHIIQKRTRKTDTFARWGGEEFIQILPNTTLEMAYNIAEELREIVASYNFKNNLKLTCSFGVAEFNSEDIARSLMKRVDDALYRAKNSGRNRVES